MTQLIGFLVLVLVGYVSGTTVELIDRARRESLLRMKAEAHGYDLIINVRLETSSIGGEAAGKNKIQSVECYVYGTAIRYAR